MDGVLKSDIFFFITSLAVIGISVAALFLMYQIHRLLKEIHAIARHTRQGTAWLLEDFDEMREAVREKGLRLRFLLNFFRGLFEQYERPRRRSRREEVIDDGDIDDLDE